MPPRFARRIKVKIFFCIMEVFDPLKKQPTQRRNYSAIHQKNSHSLKFSGFLIHSMPRKKIRMKINTNIGAIAKHTPLAYAHDDSNLITL